MQNTKPIILASQSPRRFDLLSKTAIPFEVIPSRIEEMPPMDERPNTYAVRTAYEKALAVAEEHPDRIVIGADTVVAVEDRILGKPKSPQDAQLMLGLLSGKWHEVWTGISVLHLALDITENRAVKSEVHFKELTLDEIEAYIETGEPMDKAGSYGIQGKAKRFVKEIKGSYENIVGLPVFELCKILDKLGVRVNTASL
jgi:septum formation protein